MRTVQHLGLLLFIAILLTGCPSGAEKTQTDKKKDEKTTTTTPAVEEPSVDTSEGDALLKDDESKWGSDIDETKKNYSLYREYYKQQNYNDALPFWRYVYQNAPSARKTPLVNGVKMYNWLLDEEIVGVFCEDGEVEGKSRNECKKAKKGKFKAYKFKNPAVAQAYQDTMLMIYNTRQEHFGEEGTIYTLKYRLVKKYDPLAEDSLYNMQQKIIELDSEYSSYDVVKDYFKNLYYTELKDKTITNEDFIAKYDALTEIIDFNVNRNEDNDEDAIADYEKVGTYMSEKYDKWSEAVEKQTQVTAVKNLTDCPSIKSHYGAEYAAAPNDINAIKTYYKALKRGGCKNDPDFMKLLIKWSEVEPSASRLRYIAQQYQKSSNLNEAQNYYQKSLEIETDPSKKAKTYLSLARIAQVNKQYSKARDLARKAIENQAGWGTPYMLIGDLYASSTSSVKSDGVNGRTAYYAAVDMYEKAKDVDPSVSDKADEKIKKYRAAFPSQDDKTNYFMQKSKPFPAIGQRISVGGWIGQSTTVR